MDILALVLFGMLIGFVGGYAGISGAPFFVAFLVLAMSVPQHMAQGTVLAVMLGPMSIPAVWAMRHRFLKLWHYAAVGVLTYAAFSYIGGALAFVLNEALLKVIFGLLLLVIGGKQILGKAQNTKQAVLHKSGFYVHKEGRLPIHLFSIGIVGALVGIVGGMLGVGAGIVMLPFFTSGMHIAKNDARLMSLAILLPPVSIGAVIQYQANASIDWRIAMVLLLAYLSTNFFGARQGEKTSPERFSIYFGCILLALSMLMIVPVVYSAVSNM